MSALGGSTPIVYHDDTEMRNGGNGGEGSRQIVPSGGTSSDTRSLEPIGAPEMSTSPEGRILKHQEYYRVSTH